MKIKNSTILLIGSILIVLGVIFGFLEYFEEKKNKAYSDMSILLYENENPDNIESDEKLGDNNTEEPNNPDNPDNNPDVPTQQPNEDNKNNEINYDYIGILEIPKINLKRGFLDINSRYNNVNKNITVIKGSTFPNQENNNLILAAHSGICKVCYFDKLYKLKENYIAYISYKGTKYTYKIVKIYEVEKTGTVSIYRDYNKNTLTLITCTRNSNTKQTVYILELTNKQKV